MDAPQSRHNLPNNTADSPISEPTDKSMPPATITGVSATASKPISTLRRTTSNALSRVKKFVPRTAKIAISSASMRANTSSCVSFTRVRGTWSGNGKSCACILPPFQGGNLSPLPCTQGRGVGGEGVLPSNYCPSPQTPLPGVQEEVATATSMIPP